MPDYATSKGLSLLIACAMLTACGQDDANSFESPEEEEEPSIIVKQRCAQGQHVTAQRCVTCPDGTTRSAGDDPTGANTQCTEAIATPTPCTTDHRVQAGMCVACPTGTGRAAGDNPRLGDTLCNPSEVMPCNENEHVVSGRCVTCPEDTTRSSGDDPTGPDTMCHIIMARTCAENDHVVNRDCVPCEEGTRRDEGDDPDGPDTACVMIDPMNDVCTEDHRVQSDTCVPCEPGSINEAGDTTQYGDTQCEPVICALNEYVRANTCVSCEPGNTRPAGDEATGTDTSCTPIACAVNERVDNNLCTACPTGATRPAGDLANGPDTTCEVTPCAEDTHVVNHACVPCAAGSTRAAGDDPTDADTTCEEPPTGLSAVYVSAGESHSCAVTTSGGVMCWGSNQYGQLGDGSLQSSALPVDVQGITGTVVEVSAGGDHSCARTMSGGVWCWGANYSGQLGQGGTQPVLTAMVAGGLSSGVAQISAGWTHTCAVTSSGEALCWGDNYSGQLGHGGGGTSSTFPVTPVGMSSGVAQISAGGAHTCVILSTGGDVWCWGRNNDGQLGLGNTTSRTTPARKQGPYLGASQLEAGKDHTCAVVSGGVMCWGFNFFGQVTNTGSSSDQDEPVDVSGAQSGYEHVSGGQHHSCGLRMTGAFTCWGLDDESQLGNAGSRPSDLQQIDSGWAHNCGLRATGEVVCWGTNIDGQLGQGTTQTVNGFAIVGQVP